MKTVIRIVSREGSEFLEIPNPYNITPRKDDHFVWKKESYIVSWVEFDFDTNTLYIVTDGKFGTLSSNGNIIEMHI